MFARFKLKLYLCTQIFVKAKGKSQKSKGKRL